MKVASTMARKTLLAAVASLGLAAAVPQTFADSPSEYPGYGMGPGMMGGYGGYGMGPGMMGGCGGYGYGWENLKLTDAQRSQIDKILEDSARQRWELMGKMHEQGWKMRELYASGKADDAALKQAYDTMSAMRKSMFENNLETRKKIDAVLTKEQREHLRGG